MAINDVAKDILSVIAQNDNLYWAIYDILTWDNKKNAAGYTVDDLRNFLRFGQINGSSVIEGFSLNPGSTILYFDINDEFAFMALDRVLSIWVLQTYFAKYYETYTQYTNRVKDLIGGDVYEIGLPPGSPSDKVLSNTNIKTVIDHFLAQEYPFTTDEATLFEFAHLAISRIDIWKTYYDNNGSLDYDQILNEESRDSSENISANDPVNPDINDNAGQAAGLNNLILLSQKAFEQYLTAGDRNQASLFIEKATTGKVGSFNADAFYRVFQTVNPAVVQEAENGGLSAANAKNLVFKLEQTGLLRLAGYANEIANYGKKRTANLASIQKSAAEYIDESADTPWLLLLNDIIINLKRDPIFFASLSYYFPSLITFLLDAFALVGDYSNGGKGGDPNDEVNNPEVLLDSLEKAFGIDETGKAVFTLAFRSVGTAKRIEEVLKKSPFRANTAPQSPDVFHLRLGAANFYVPPVSIDVNSNFKAGSLMASALRQKNSPKFNSGYKETAVRMRLFFPNYEEIWGISIDDASTLDLNEEFKIDFRKDGDSDIKIDKFLSSLRGLVAAFKYSPFLPVKNHYLNTVHGITAVGLANMTISTIPNFPFALAVDLELVNFNHKPFLPMVPDFNQAIHWGKYRQYMGKAAGQLNRYVNEEFLLKTSDVKEIDQSGGEVIDTSSYSPRGVDTGGVQTVSSSYNQEDPVEGIDSVNNSYDYDVLTTNIVEQWRNGNHITLFAPAEAQTKIFLPSTSSFRTDEEKLMTDLGESFWDRLLNSIGIDVAQTGSYGIPLAETIDISKSDAYSKSTKNIILDAIDLITAGVNSDTQQEKSYDFLIANFITQNSNNLNDEEKDWLRNYDRNDVLAYPAVRTYNFQGKFLNSISLNSVKRAFLDISDDPKEYLNYLVEKKYNEVYSRTGSYRDREEIVEEFSKAFSVAMYERFFQSGPIQSLMEAARARSGAYQFNEWEVPMLRVDLDPNAVIVNGVTVSLANNIVKLQVQMQDEPTYQHIGGKDSVISISMTVIGEKELVKLRAMFDHVSGLARLEHASGVIGFLGIKNIITALAGIKYIMPLTYNVSTKPNFPHVYDVQLTLVDFDIFQQKRENLSSRQQAELVEEFGTKRNPFLRIKQLWGAFNAYPDFPLAINNSTGETVGCLDPDFYFRSFEMFDNDVINHIDKQVPMVDQFTFEEETHGSADTIERNKQKDSIIRNKILEFIRIYNLSSEDAISRAAKQNLYKDMAEYIAIEKIDINKFYKIFYDILNSDNKDFSKESATALLTSFIQLSSDSEENNPYFMLEAQAAAYQVGNVSPNDVSMLQDLEAALAGEYNLVTGFDSNNKNPVVQEEVSFDPDEVMFHKQIFMIPAADVDDKESNKIPAFMQTVLGTHFGYIDKSNGRFYLVVGGENVKIDPKTGKSSLKSNFIEDTETPDRGVTKTATSVPGTSAYSEYQKPHGKSVARHWETMLVDTKYRDLSGRMIRAFPTYMLWLIDEGGYFAGVKMFDNFYGLQSIIDFSVVSSEDLLGDTLIFRVSNLYSKLTKKESSAIFSVSNDFNDNSLSLDEGLAGIVDRALNISRNVLSGLRNEYIVDIANIRLKPGVRVHLRAGYGSNPNSLQTLFNGVITNVEQGEIVTVTAQSDAIELGAVVNSADKKGDSGKIDGGIDTGLYMSEPRDLMVRLLSMGTSRVREAFAHATRGTVFSENRFGIRHFGTVLYQPLNDFENKKHSAIRDEVAQTLIQVGGGKADGGFSFGLRGSLVPLMSQMWANFSVQPDLEIFKRNIYAGNGLGIAQFLGGDLEDGWGTAASLVPDESYNDRTDGYLGRLTDLTYNRLLENYQKKDDSAKETIEMLTAGNKLVAAEGRAGLIKGALGAGVTGIAAIFGGPILGATVGTGLLGVLSGRGGTNIFRTMGLISPNDDDDLPGFDEVSFRAQTYMRTVWDLFQTCARLLPNYIVAVRPFEDRSTVFYGKPHWLYTSGVMPITTGFPGEKEAREKGKPSGPGPITPDENLNKILSTINKDANPLADYAKFFQAYEPNETFKTVSEAISNSTGIYSPTSYFAGKLLNFYSPPAHTFYEVGPSSTRVVSKLPVSKGFVGIGPHLPVIPKEARANAGLQLTEATLASQLKVHKQITQLPPRYGFPYFAVNENYKLQNSSTIFLRSSNSVAMDKIAPDEEDSTEIIYNNLDSIIYQELDWFKETNFSLMPSLGDDTVTGTINYDTPLDFGPIYDQISGDFPLDVKKMLMPLPQVGLTNYEGAIGNISANAVASNPEAFSIEYQTSNYGKLTYKEWEAPETPEDEQFYIAMRWPYNPDETKNDPGAIEAFKSKYFGGNQELYGEAKDYKKRKVLVYNPATQRAVVCRPAYFMWAENNESYDSANVSEVSALVSPDAALFLSIITYTQEEAKNMLDGGGTYAAGQRYPQFNLLTYPQMRSGYRSAPEPQECMFAFVPDDIPVGVLSTSIGSVSKFKAMTTERGEITYTATVSVNPTTGETETKYTPNAPVSEQVESEDAYVIGFGNFSTDSGEELIAVSIDETSSAVNTSGGPMIFSSEKMNKVFNWYKPQNAKYKKLTDSLAFGGNLLNIKDEKSYFQLVIEKDFTSMSKDELDKKLEDIDENQKATMLVPVYDPSDMISVQARSFFDEKFDTNVNVIAGNGRTNHQATQIWDQFRKEYHTYDSVKRIFFDIYNLDPDMEDEFPAAFKSIITGENITNIFPKFSASNDSAYDEFQILFGSDYNPGNNTINRGADGEDSRIKETGYQEVLDFMRKNYIDANLDDGGLIEYFNTIITRKLKNIYESFFNGENINSVLQFSIEAKDEAGNKVTADVAKILKESINTPKQLFLFLVGIFRQRMWEDPYARAWLVLKPDRKPGWTSGNGWSFRPVDKIFRAFIDPASDYAKPSKKAKFLQLLVSTRGEGSESNTYFSSIVDDVGEFAARTIGPIVTAVSDALSALISTFKTSMQQLGYALSEVGNFKKQANVLNKVLNDSIYYSLGRPGTILRAVDNPFTREYGEPVIEIREPFQRIHYISSFSHILSNQIQENINNVATVVTAVSDGKYPVTVALDKAAPAERQTEKTIETGIFFDNATGSGLFGTILHPFFHPLETFRGMAKAIQGTPDELSARRIALSHLKESIKDIYGGELLIIGNGDIRPHDLVYLSDVYERMYGIFEVEQVIHHFTPELGYITSITPNALVTVNDPARWFMTSWMHSWMNVQNIRNDARIYLDNIRNANAGLSVGGNISVDKLGEALNAQIVGGFQFTHGSSALVKDIMANQTAVTAPGISQSLTQQAAQGSNALPAFALIAGTILTGGLAWKGWKWVRDNVLDQHGCYVQYLNRNGQPMDAGLSFNQGMVVGSHHSKALLPGLLGTRVKARTPEGNAYIRTDDLLKNLGWQEVEINDLRRQISYETALVHAQVSKLSGLGPEKASFEWQFKVIAKLERVIDGDTIEVADVISGLKFTVRFDGVNTAETNTMEAKVDFPDTNNTTNLSFLDISTPGGKAKIFVQKALTEKLMVLRINQTRTSGSTYGKAVLEEDFEPGSKLNTIENYQLDIFGSGDRENSNSVEGSRVLATIFYRNSEELLSQCRTYVSNLFRSNISSLANIKTAFKNDLYNKSVFYIKFDTIFDAVGTLVEKEYYNITNISDSLYNLSENDKILYSRLIYFKIIEKLYDKASEWPRVSWDEYYSDGTPITLNWELVVNNLAKVFVKDLQKESQSVQDANESLPLPRSVFNPG